MRIVLCFVAAMTLASSAYGQQICTTIKGKPWVSVSVKHSNKKLLVSLVPKKFNRANRIRVNKRIKNLIIFQLLEPKMLPNPSIPVRLISDGVAHEDALNCGVRR